MSTNLDRGEAGRSLLNRIASALHGSALLVAFALWTANALSQQYPQRPLRLVVPVAVGGSSDILARMIGLHLTEAWGQPVIIDNRPGGGTIIGTQVVARSAPDGYTLLLVSLAHASNATLVNKLPYDPVRDFSGVMSVSNSPLIMVVHPAVAADSVKGLVDLVKANPGKLTYGSAGNGTAAHLAAELFKSMAGGDIVHVPYKGSGDAVTALLGAQVQLSFPSIPPVLPHVLAGKLKALAVTSLQRSVLLPELPTISESGMSGFDASGWQGLVAPAGTPRPILERLSQEITRFLTRRDVKEKMLNQGLEPFTSSPAEFDAFIAQEVVKWGKVIKRVGAEHG